MRLREYKYILDIVIPNLELKSQPDPTNGTLIKILNSSKTIEYLNLLLKTNLFNSELKQIRSTNLFHIAENDISVSTQELSIIINNINKIKLNGGFLLGFLNQIISTEEFTFSVKIPNDINNFEDLEKISNSLKQALSLPVNLLSGEVKFIDFDLGSLWIDLITDSNTIIEFIKYMVDAGIIIWMLKKKNQSVIEHLKSFSISENSRKEVVNAEEKNIKEELTKQTNYVIQKTIKRKTKITNADGSTIENTEDSEAIIKLNNLNPEDKEIIKNGINEIAYLLSKGTDFVPTLEFNSINEEALADFPDTTKLDYTEKKELPENTNQGKDEI